MIKPFINNPKWTNINFPPKEQNYKIFKTNNKSIALNILHTHSDGKISHLYIGLSLIKEEKKM